MNDKVKTISLKAFLHIFHESEKSNRRFCFILGAGASREAGILTGVEMAKIWAKEIKEKYEEKELEALMEKLEIDSIEPNSKNYFGIYDLLYYTGYQEGYAYFERELEKGSPSLGHHVLAKILAGKRHNLAITTNFDNLIEDALYIYTDKHPLVVGHESLTGFINLNIERPIIAKIHRSLYFHPFNRKQETNCLADGWQETLKNAFKVYTPVVIGYAGGDQSLMKFLQDDDISMNGLYWCYWNKEEPSEEIQDLVMKKNGHLVPIDGFDQMMFMLSRKLHIENPENEMKSVTKQRIERYNEQYTEFDKNMREKAEGDSGEAIKNTLKALDESNKRLLEEATKCIEIEKSADNYLKRAFIYDRLSDYEHAIADYNEAIALKRDYALTYNLRAYTYRKKKEYDKAIEDYKKAIELKPDCAEYYNNRGLTYNSMGKYEKAIIDYTKAIELKPDFGLAYNNRGVAYREIEKYEKAIEDFNKAVELKPDYAKIYNNRGLTYKNMEKSEKAIEDFNKAIELKPDYASAYNNRGYLYDFMGEHKKALEDLKKAIQLKPELANPYKHIGSIKYHEKNYEEALSYLNKALKLNSNYKEAYELRSKVYRELNRFDEAEADEKSVENIEE